MIILPAGPEHAGGVGDLLALASRGCFCRWWHFEGDDLSWQGRCNLEPEANRVELEAALEARAPEAAGIVAIDEQVVGWLKLSPAAQMQKLLGRRLYRSLDCFGGDRSRTLVVGCVVVHPARRRAGTARALLAGAIDHARRIGAAAIEAMPRCSPEALRDDELWMGPAILFEEQGFERVDGPDAYPVLRRRL
jgi:GNAT superfamily N-acetyltransferase